ncbi:ubiquitin carboxyl-terminal hydrolase 37-like [Onychostoma macrolepis]|uniref:ubiquitin carboxyl-terminal hydrolase 37-like n=1 Tax=Onychostoma macrolepis TaxID=369639 RepID=UPI00272D4833|nr:ubiquitin carboxyl-terminal hydrolase 37-like [Onychostoma macrolepis]
MDSSDSDLKETHLAKVKSYIESHFPVFKGHCQQDAHEFFMACLSRLKEESMSLRSSHPSYTCPVSSMEFKLRSERTCNSCGLMKSFTEESNCLSLVIGPHASLTDSLQQYMNASFIDCVCSLCGGPQASETLKFLSLPRVLVLLVQRFDFTSSMIKLKNRLEIPEELTLSCVKERTKQPETDENSRAGSRSFLQKIFRKKNRVAPQTPQEEAPVVISSQYRLSAVVSHAGSHLFFGHYISQIRERREDGWLRCSDASVRRSSWSEVSEDAGDNGYLLFYVKS